MAGFELGPDGYGRALPHGKVALGSERDLTRSSAAWRCGVGVMLLAQNQIKDAAETLAELVVRRSDLAEGQYNYACALARWAMRRGALDHLRAAVQLDRRARRARASGRRLPVAARQRRVRANHGFGEVARSESRSSSNLETPDRPPATASPPPAAPGEGAFPRGRPMYAQGPPRGKPNPPAAKAPVVRRMARSRKPVSGARAMRERKWRSGGNFCILPQMRLAASQSCSPLSPPPPPSREGRSTITLLGGMRGVVPGNGDYLTEQGPRTRSCSRGTRLLRYQYGRRPPFQIESGT